MSPMNADRRLAVALVLTFGLAASLYAGQGRELTGAELVKLGFFQDFDEFDLEALLDTGDVKTAIASRRPETLEEAPGVVAVLTGDEIRRMGARTLEDVLRSLPGFDVLTDNLGRSRVVLRGVAVGSAAGSDSVLILFNGHRLNEDLSGRATVINLDIAADGIRRLEVLRGPASALYGAGALAGVVNIVTDSIEDFTGIALSAGLGSFETREFGLRVGNSIRELSISGFVHFSDASGARLLVPRDAQTVADGSGGNPLSLAPGRTTDNLRSLETAYRLAFRDLSLGLRVKNENSGGFIGATESLGTQNDLNNRQLSLDLGYRRNVGSDGSLAGTVAFTQNEISQLLEVLPPGYERPTPTGVSRFPSGVFLQTALNTRRVGGEIVFDRGLGERHRITAGASLERESTFELEAKGNLDFRTLTANSGLAPLPGAVSDAHRTAVGLFAQDAWEVTSRVTATAGLRLDDLSDTERAVSPRVALVAGLLRGLMLKVLYGRAFRPPTFTELHFDLPGMTGNPDLDATTADTVEASLGYKGRELRVTGTLFLSWIDDPIGLAGPFDLLRSQRVVNLADARTRGFELELRRNFGIDDSIFLSYTRQDAEERASGLALPDVAADLAAIGASFHVGEHLIVSPTARFRGERPRASGDSRPPLPAYGVADVSARTRNLYRGLEISGTVSNLFDRRYHDPSPSWGVPGDYPRPGRAAYVTATYKF
ncbi:MAG: TonB-dependent receptor [Acidobacteria bacterium]|nr:TonB-dependent receptor [Acidobacteriota bacterium]